MDVLEKADLRSTLSETPSSEPVKTETPSVELPTKADAAPVTEAAPATTENIPAKMEYELPDGRKVDAETLTKEWKENFLPDYTRKSQKIADIEKQILPTKENKPYWEDPNWAPQTTPELLKMIDDRNVYLSETAKKAQEQQQAYLKSLTDNMEAEVKRLDPKVDINKVYLHANKLKSSDLIAAYKNLVEIETIEKQAQEKVLKNLKERDSDLVSTGNQTQSGDGLDYSKIRGGSIHDIRL